MSDVERTLPCDGGCTYDGPDETCSAHGRPPAEIWAIVREMAEERDNWKGKYYELREYNEFPEYGLAFDIDELDDASVVALSSEPSDPYEFRENYAPNGIIVERVFLVSEWQRWVDPDDDPKPTDQEAGRG